ncbi:MAG TPA: riboflavin synthase [Gaiellaceae bacterium]|nr:riboflavin synthase [Gaiellaceae bacterium]
MFTGIVRERGRVVSAEPNGDGGALRLRIAAPLTAARTGLGDSVSVAGCCLTAIAADDGELVFEAVPESLARTTIGQLAEGAHVNLEPALRAGEPLGGHYVQGHVDGVGEVLSMHSEGDGSRIRIDVSDELLRYCVEKGSITVDGVSLTIASLDDQGVEIALVPHTLNETTLAALGPGDRVNIEVDVLAKYVERLIAR